MKTQCRAGADTLQTTHYMGGKPAPFTSDRLEKRKSLTDNLTKGLTGELGAQWESLQQLRAAASDKPHPSAVE